MSLKIVLTLLLIAACLSSMSPAFGAGPSGDRVPNYIEVVTDGAIIIEAAPMWENPDACLHPHRIVIPASNVQLTKYYAAALTAFAGRDYIWAWVAGCRTMPWGEEYPIVINMATRAR